MKRIFYTIAPVCFVLLLLTMMTPNVFAIILSFTENVLRENYRANFVYVVDLDGDSDSDIVAAGSTFDEVFWFKNDGSESFTKTAIGSFTDAREALPIDLDEDGDIDLVAVAADSGDKVVWFDNDGSESFTQRSIDASANGALAVDVIDMDGDGDLDVVAGLYTDADIKWYDNNGSETFTEKTVELSFSAVDAVDAIDLDEDGDVDIIATGLDGVSWFSNNGTESFTESAIDATNTSMQSVQVIDLDGDSDLDVVVSGGSSGISWYENNGSESFTEYILSISVSSIEEAFVINFDGDSDLDIVATSSAGDGTVFWMDNNGSESFLERTVNDAFFKANYIHAGDIDGDGDADIVASPILSWSGDISWFAASLDSTSPTVSTFSPEDGATGVAVDANLVITFDENIGSSGTGYLTIYNAADDSIVEQISTATGAVTGTGGTTMTIDPSTNFANGASYYIQIDANAFPDITGNGYAGIADTTTWNFTVVAASSSGGGAAARQRRERIQATAAGRHASASEKNYREPPSLSDVGIFQPPEDQQDSDDSDSGTGSNIQSALPSKLIITGGATELGVEEEERIKRLQMRIARIEASEEEAVVAPKQQDDIVSVFQSRACLRVKRRFTGNQTMIDRVNGRLKKQFGFSCDVK